MNRETLIRRLVDRKLSRNEGNRVLCMNNGRRFGCVPCLGAFRTNAAKR